MRDLKAHLVGEMIPSYTHQREIVVGVALPATGVTFCDVPAEFGVIEYSYTAINDRTVLVEPRSRKILQILG